MQHATRKNRKRRLVWLGIVGPFVLATAAVAAWVLIGSGHGDGTDTTGTAANAPVTVTVTSATDALTPGGTAGDIAYKVLNGNASDVVINTAPVLSVLSTSAGAACDPTNFTVTQEPIASWRYGSPGSENQSVTAFPITLHAGQDLVTGPGGGTQPKLAMISAAPTGCENVTVNVRASVDGG